MVILGIDPGFDRLGCAILKKEQGKEKLLYSSCLRSDKKLAHENRILSLAKDLEKIISKYKPDIMAVESLFFSKNQKTAMKVSEARGMILHVAASNKIIVKEVTPLQIKIALTGYGRAEKTQVQKMAWAILGLKTKPKSDDEADAVACAITCSSTLSTV